MGSRIAIDGRYLTDHYPGIGRYAFHLVKELANLEGPEVFEVFFNPSALNSRFDLEQLKGERVTLQPLDVLPFSPRSQVALPLALRQGQIDLFHSPHYLVPFMAPCPQVCTIHDTIPLGDPSFLPSRRGRVAYRLALLLALARSEAIIVDSEASRQDLLRHLPVDPRKLRVIHLGVDMSDWQPLDAGAKGHILYVGANKPHKNLPRLIEAYALAGASLPLVIAGPLDPRFPQAERKAKALGLDPRFPQGEQKKKALGLKGQVRFLGHVGEDQLRELYRSAALLVLPSLAEGFGLPALEAMAHGVPVIVSNRPPLPEVVGEAAILVDPLDTQGWASAMARVLEDRALAQDLGRRGRGRAALFSWRKTAQAHLSLYRELGLGS